MTGMQADFRVVAEDIAMLRERWLAGDPSSLSEAELRRGSAVLSVLLLDGLAARAWRALGKRGQPAIVAPSLEMWLDDRNIPRNRVVVVVAGGGRLNGVDTAFLGALRVDNPTTGVSADADVGYAIRLMFTSRDAREHIDAGPVDRLIFVDHHVSRYLNSLSGIRFGEEITRRDVLTYFRNAKGGAHHSAGNPPKRPKDRQKNALIAQFGQQIIADITDGLHFELLSIGQCVARSPDFILLARELGTSPRWSQPAKPVL